MSVIKILKSTLFRKIIMSLTGLFIAFFLIIHLAGNLQLLLPFERAHLQYNWYSHLLSSNILIEIIAILLYISFLVHIFNSIFITYENYKSNGTGLKKIQEENKQLVFTKYGNTGSYNFAFSHHSPERLLVLVQIQGITTG